MMIFIPIIIIIIMIKKPYFSYGFQHHDAKNLIFYSIFGAERSAPLPR